MVCSFEKKCLSYHVPRSHYRGLDSCNMPVDFSDLQQSKCSTPELTLLFQGDSSFCVSTLVNLIDLRYAALTVGYDDYGAKIGPFSELKSLASWLRVCAALIPVLLTIKQ